MATIKYFHEDRELTSITSMPNREFAARFPGVKGRRYDSFNMTVGWCAATHAWLPVDRQIVYQDQPSRHACDARCLNANGKIMRCECACGGRNHGLGRLSSLSERTPRLPPAPDDDRGDHNIATTHTRSPDSASRHESDQERSHREWRENWFAVVGDLEGATYTNLYRASCYGRYRINGEHAKAQKSLPWNAALVDSIERELHAITLELRRRPEHQRYLVDAAPTAPHATLRQRAADGFPTGADAIMREAYGPIPEATHFQRHYCYIVPTTVHGWAWSTTFGRWSALVTFPDGWHGYTYPKP
ncbi:hypothetical protein [Burkholderia sp. MBR-1]|uniref:hypothetical protein n=1 Tax=Burkholderia sp. MBR-1 TaxID=2732364 RepID=UPI00215DC407|nr:hypothetical protein [Burkholderia sp. MBR-1]